MKIINGDKNYRTLFRAYIPLNKMNLEIEQIEFAKPIISVDNIVYNAQNEYLDTHYIKKHEYAIIPISVQFPTSSYHEFTIKLLCMGDKEYESDTYFWDYVDPINRFNVAQIETPKNPTPKPLTKRERKRIKKDLKKRMREQIQEYENTW